MGSADIGGKIFLTTNVLLKYEKVRISLKKDNNDLMEHFFKLHSKWSQNAITVKEEVAMQYRSLEKAMKMDSTALMEHFLSLFIGECSTVKEEYPEESLDSLTSQPTQSASLGEASTPPVMEYNNVSISQDGSTSASPRNLVQSRDIALCSISSNTAIKNSGALYMNNQDSSIPTVHVPLDSGVLLHQLSGTSSLSHTFSQKRKLSGSSDGDVPASKIPGIQHHVRHLHPSQSSGELLQQENIPDRRPLIEGTTGHHLFSYQTGSTRNDYGKPSATFSLQDVEQQQSQGIRTSAFHSDRSKDSNRDISKTTLDFTESVAQVTPVDSVHSLRLSVDRVGMGSTIGSETLERSNILGMNISQQPAKGSRQNRVSMDNSLNIHPQPGTSGVNQSFSGAVTEFDLSAVKIEVNSDEDLEEVSRESGDQEALAAMVTDAGNSNTLEKQYSIPKAGIYKAEIASVNGMVELVNGTNVYVHLDEYRTAINKSVPKLYKRLDNSQEIHKDGKRIARYLMSIFFEKKELQERSLTNSELSRYPPLNQKIVNAILESKANRDDLKSISISKRRQFSSRDPLDAAQIEEPSKTTRMPCSVLRIANENRSGEQASLKASEISNQNRNENSDADEAALFFTSIQHDGKMELENENQGGVTEHQDHTFHVTDASAPLFLDKSIRKLGPKLNSVNRRQARMESSLQRLEAKCDLIIHSVAQLVTKSQLEPHSIQQAQQLLQTTVSSSGLSTDAHCFDSVFHQVSDYNSIKSQPFGTCLEDPFHDVPLEYKMSMRVLEKLKSQSSGPGNFAVKISERLYPELFTAENLRLKYSYFGGGVLNKQELDPQRKEILQRYVLSFYPEYQNPDLWKSQIVAKVNENLRRPVQRKRVKIPDNEW